MSFYPAPRPDVLTRRSLLACALGAALAAGAPSIQASSTQEPSICFGILPIGGTLDSRNDWIPLLAHLEQVLMQPVVLRSVETYEALAQAIERGEVDMAFLSGKMAVDAVALHEMDVLVQVSRHDGLPGYRAIMLALEGGPVATLDDVLARPEYWRLARGGPKSMSGYIVPQLQLFLPRGLRLETHFRSEIVGTHQTCALAVANQQADVGLNNTADFERFTLQFPQEARRLKTIWSSDLIPHGVIVMHRRLRSTLGAQTTNFLAQYGRGTGPQGDEQRAVLKALHDFAGFPRANNQALVPAERLYHAMAVQSARTSRWVSEEALQTRLQRLEDEHARRLEALMRP